MYSEIIFSSTGFLTVVHYFKTKNDKQNEIFQTFRYTLVHVLLLWKLHMWPTLPQDVKAC